MVKVVHKAVFCICVFALSFLLFSGNFASADTVDYIVNVAPSFNITLSANNVTLDLNPNTKTSDAKDLNIKVSTNNMTGYYLTMSSTGDATDLVRDNTADGKNAVIPTLSAAAGTTAASLTDNTWGYKQESGNFIPYVSGVKLLENKHATNEDETTLSFASKINYSQAAGSYELGLTLTGVANPMMNYMQDFNPAFCTSEPQTVIDIRDDKEYTIARLADGNCWLLDNLHLDISDPAVQANLDSTTTNATDTSLGYLKNGGGSSPYATAGVIAKTATGGSWSDSYNAPYIATAYENTIQPASGSSPAGKIGIFYNYCAASAGSYCYASGSSSGDASQDICPAGWRMPTGGATTGEYQVLYEAYGSNITNFQSALRTPLSGYILSGSIGVQSTYSYYWSSTRSSNTGMYILPLSSSAFRSQPNTSRYYGFSVRCILNDTRTVSDITYMQDMNPQIVANTANSATATLTDLRDGQKYTVAKINGKVWMTRNLAIGCNGANTTYGDSIAPIELTPATSNVSSNWTTPASSLSSVGDDYINPLIECSATYGAWYNYAAATAGDIAGSSNITRKASYDVCPSGWRLATHSEQTGIVSYASLYNGVLGGYWKNKQITDTIYGWQWSSEYGANMQYYLIRWDGSALDAANRSGYRSSGNYVRCVSK